MAKKIGLLFPGQGSQYVGMGKKFFEKYPEAKKIFNQANEILDYDLKQIIFYGPEEKLRETEITQPAVFVTSLACFKVFTLHFTLYTLHCFTAGHSLGEYSALVAAEVLDFTSALKLVKKRAQFIQEASLKRKGKMVAILGLDKEKVKQICSSAQVKGVVEPVNFNCPGQIIISGETAAVEYAAELVRAEKAKTVTLNVSGPFHSPLMEEASEKLALELENYQFNESHIPVVTNCDAQVTTSGEETKKKLIKQIVSPVLWEETINKMVETGLDTFIEIGPGKILSGLVKRINEKVKLLNIENEESLHNCLKLLNV